MDTENKKARIIKSNRLLEAKVGAGLVKEELVMKSQKLIDNNKVDFAPMAKEYLDVLKESLAIASSNEKENPDMLQEMTEPIMQLKANAAMFNYVLVGNLANIMLNFLETINDIDSDVLEIVEAHQKTLILIIGNEIKGDGGDYGKELTTELKDACKRYFAKQENKGNAIEDKDAFFIDKA